MRKVTPILFSAPMVRAILREIENPGTGKTQTRRTIKLPTKTFSGGPIYERKDMGGWAITTTGGPGVFRIGRCGKRIEVPEAPAIWHQTTGVCLALNYAVGDVLWVRETWCRGPVGRDGIVDDWSDFLYRASNPEIEGIDDGDGYAELNADGSLKSCWKPSIHMPRKASRIVLDVTDVRVERLNDISESDCWAEGVCRDRRDGEQWCWVEGTDITNAADAREAYFLLWEKINGKGSVSVNPFLVAISFRPHLINVDAFLKQREAA